MQSARPGRFFARAPARPVRARSDKEYRRKALCVSPGTVAPAPGGGFFTARPEAGVTECASAALGTVCRALHFWRAARAPPHLEDKRRLSVVGQRATAQRGKLPITPLDGLLHGLFLLRSELRLWLGLGRLGLWRLHFGWLPPRCRLVWLFRGSPRPRQCRHGPP